MNLSFAMISTSILLLGAVAGTSAQKEDGSSILRGAISSSSTHNTAAGAILIGDDAAAAQNLRRSYRQSCDMYTPCPYGKFCKMDDGMCLASTAAAAEADESSEEEDASDALLVDTSPPLPGVCKRKPSISVCTVGEDPEVCGCDGKTYTCRQDAYYNGVNVDHVGSCSGSGSSSQSSSGGRYIVNAGSPNKRAISIAGGGSSCAAGANIQLFHQVNGDHQKWIYHTNTGLIESVACPGMVLNIDGGVNSNCAAETNIILWYDSGVEWEKWMYSPNGKLISMYCDNMVLDIFNGSDSDGANIQLFYDTGSDSWNQKWNFE